MRQNCMLNANLLIRYSECEPICLICGGGRVGDDPCLFREHWEKRKVIHQNRRDIPVAGKIKVAFLPECDKVMWIVLFELYLEVIH